MFTGIIKEVGKVVKKDGSGFTFEASAEFCARTQPSESISVNGVCLTVLDKPTKTSLSFMTMPETTHTTMLGKLNVGDKVNLELPMTADSFMSGHIVQGHVDGTGRIAGIKKVDDSYLFVITLPERLSIYAVEKGSISVNGISLTLLRVAETYFSVSITPFTWEHTMLHAAKVGDLVNIEVDILAKYVDKLISQRMVTEEK